VDYGPSVSIRDFMVSGEQDRSRFGFDCQVAVMN
jgi:hypothetical protein